MAEVHFIGQILEATDFDEDRSLFLKWSINSGSCWRSVEGFTEGQTQLTRYSKEKRTQLFTDNPQEDVDRGLRTIHSWSHPVDVHYVTKGLQGWPRMEFEIWGVDWLGKCNISAYGFINLPSKPGVHELECSTWRLVGDFRRRFIDYLTGHRMHLLDRADIVGSGLNRHMIQALSMGSIRIQLTAVLRGFHEHGVDV